MIIDKNKRSQIINVVLPKSVREGVREREDEKVEKSTKIFEKKWGTCGV